MIPFDAAKPRSSTKSPSMSLEQALFEEEQEVLKLIGERTDSRLPPPPPPIGSSNRNGSVSGSRMLGPSGALNNKQGRSSSYVGNRRDLESLLSPQAYQFPVAANVLSRASDIGGSRRKSTPDHHRRSSSPSTRPSMLGSPQTSPPPAVQSFDKAYRRLSNAAMAQSGGSLSRLAAKSSLRSGLSQGSDDHRLEKDKDHGSVIETSSSSDSESETSRPTSRAQSPSIRQPGRSSQDELTYETRHDHVPFSLSAAADQESISLTSM